jgi:hypothetical protein
MAMPTNIPKSTRRGRSTWANIACFVSGISRINAGDVDKRYLPMNALHTGCADRVRASDRPIRGGQNWRIYTSGWEYGAFAHKELPAAGEIWRRCLLTGF